MATCRSALHRGIEGGSRRALSASKFTTLVSEQVQRSPKEHCVTVDPYGVEGKIGAIGALFKLELTPYGYTPYRIYLCRREKEWGDGAPVIHEQETSRYYEALRYRITPKHDPVVRPLPTVQSQYGRGYCQTGFLCVSILYYSIAPELRLAK